MNVLLLVRRMLEWNLIQRIFGRAFLLVARRSCADWKCWMVFPDGKNWQNPQRFTLTTKRTWWIHPSTSPLLQGQRSHRSSRTHMVGCWCDRGGGHRRDRGQGGGSGSTVKAYETIGMSQSSWVHLSFTTLLDQFTSISPSRCAYIGLQRLWRFKMSTSLSPPWELFELRFTCQTCMGLEANQELDEMAWQYK